MDHARVDAAQHDEVRAFTEEVLRSGLMLTDVLGRLLEDLPENAFPGEDPVEVLLEMMTGTIRSTAYAAGARAVREATMLLGAVCDRVLSDLRTAADRARQA